MSDLIEIGVEVRTNSVKSATKEIDTLGKTLKSAERSASAFVEAFTRQERQVSKAAEANRNFARTAQNMYNEILNVNRATKSASDSASVFERSLNEQARQVEQLSMKYKPLYATSKLYERMLNEINTAQKLGVLSDKQRQASLAELNRDFQTGTGVFANYANAAGKSANRMGVAMQQTGYQVGDFLVQVQSGTNPMVAFGQQATQLVGIMYLLPQATLAAKVGIGALKVSLATLTLGLGIAIPLVTAIGAAFIRTSKETDETKDSLEELDSTLESLIKRMDDWVLAKRASQAGLTLDELIGKDSLSAAKKEMDSAKAALDELNESIAAISAVGGGEALASLSLMQRLGWLPSESDVALAEKRVTEATEALNLATQKAREEEKAARDENVADMIDVFREAQKRMREEDEATRRLREDNQLSMIEVFRAAQKRMRDEQAATDAEIAKGYANSLGFSKQLTNETDAYVKSAAEGFKQTEKLKEQLGEGAYEALRLAGVDMTSGIDAAAKAAARLAADLNISLAAALTMQKMASDEDAVMSQSVVKGKATDRYDADTLLGMGYTEEYLKLIGKIKDETKKLGGTTKKTLTDAEKALEEAQKAAKAYADALDNTVVAAVGSVSDAWADFVMRGFKDFKGFVGSVLDSFKNMIVQMIAIAAKNRIMLSLGIGGVAPTAAMAGSGLLGGAGILGGGGAGIGAAISGVGSGLSGVLSGGGMASSFANLGGLASGAVGGLGAVGAAIPAVGALIAGAMVLKKIFGGKKPLFSEAQFDAMADAALLTGQSFRELAADLEGVESGVVDMTRATQAVIKGIADATGGMEKFGALAQFFFGNFYTEAEQQQYSMAKATEELNKQFAELNVAVPQTHEEYRKLVHAQDLTTESGREMYAALLNASEAFVAVKGSAEQASEAQKAYMAEQTIALNARTLSREVSAFQEEQQSLRNIEEVGTTVAQNEYLLDQFVEDYNKYVDDFNSDKDQYQAQLSKIDRNQLEELTTLDDDLQKALEATSGVQASILEWYTGIKKTNDDIINMIKESIEEGTGATTADLKAFKQQGEFTQNFADVFGKYGMFEQMPYYLELIMYTKDRIREIRGFKSAAVDVMKSFGDYNEAFSVVPDAMMDLNRSLTGMAPEIKNAANLMGQIAFNFASAFDALTLGYGKISEAVGKVNTFYKEQFSALAAEYNVQDVATQSIDISARMGEIIEAPAKLIQTIEDSKARLDRELNKLNKVAGQLNSRMYHLTQNGIEVSGELAASYDEISAAATKANKAAGKATEELKALQLYVSTMTQAVTDFQGSVEKMLVQGIEDGVKFFEPSLLSDLSGNTKVLVANILNSITAGGYEAFEEGFVRLTDMFTQNSLTVDQFNQSFGLLKDVFEGNISLTDEYTQKQASVVEKLSNAYDNLTSSLEDMLSVVSRGIGSLVGQTASANVVATRLGSLSYLSSVSSGGQAEAGSLERAVSSVTSIGATDFGTRQDFMRYVADTTQLLRSVEGTLQGQVDTLEMQQVQAILGIQDTNESAATSLQSIQSLLAEFLGAGGRIPQFASGGYHSGGLRIVGENGPELEATGPSRIIPNNKISVGGGDSELRREVAEMRTDLKTALVQIAKNTRKSSDTLNKFDYQGLPDSRGY